MIITICGSIAFISEMESLAEHIRTQGHDVLLPPHSITLADGREMSCSDFYEIRQSNPDDGWVWDEKKTAIVKHFEKVAQADAVLIANYEKRGVSGYIGANTLMEMGLALYLNKPIYCLFPLPNSPYIEEIRGMQPIVLDGNISSLLASI